MAKEELIEMEKYTEIIDVDVEDIDMLEINRDINERWVQSLVDYILKFGFLTNIVVVPYEAKNGKIVPEMKMADFSKNNMEYRTRRFINIFRYGIQLSIFKMTTIS